MASPSESESASGDGGSGGGEQRLPTKIRSAVGGWTTWHTAGAVVGVTVVAGAAWLATRYRVASPDQVLAVVGPFVNTASGIKIAKRTFLLPYQRATTVKLDVAWLNVRLAGALSRDKLHVDTPFKISFRPREDDITAYVKSFADTPHEEMMAQLTEQATCDLREIVASRDIDDIFNDQEATRTLFVNRLAEQWRQYGIEVIACVPENVGDPRGTQGYFHNLSLRQMERSKAEGAIGTQEQQRRSRTVIAGYETEAVTAEQENLVRQKSATATAAQRVLELQQAVELLKISQERSRSEAALEAEAARLRTRDMAATVVQNEVELAKATMEATRIRTLAEARYFEAERAASANKIRLIAEAEGLQQVIAASGGSLPDYIRLKLSEGTNLHDIMKTSADGMRGMAPKVTILATGSDAAGRAVEAMNSSGIALASAFTTVEEALGVKILPSVLVPNQPQPAPPAKQIK